LQTRPRRAGGCLGALLGQRTGRGRPTAAPGPFYRHGRLAPLQGRGVPPGKGTSQWLPSTRISNAAMGVCSWMTDAVRFECRRGATNSAGAGTSASDWIAKRTTRRNSKSFPILPVCRPIARAAMPSTGTCSSGRPLKSRARWTQSSGSLRMTNGPCFRLPTSPGHKRSWRSRSAPRSLGHGGWPRHRPSPLSS